MTTKEWVENWKRIGTVLKQLKADELCDDYYYDSICELCRFSIGRTERAEPRQSLRLVEQ